MSARTLRALVALLLTTSAAGVGYHAGATDDTRGTERSAVTIEAPKAGTTRILYSLDAKQNDQELISLIESADEYVHFAIYTFTLNNVADALIAAKKRGVDVRGLMDSEQSANSYGAPITQKLVAAGIPILTEDHETGNGIMHLKLLVTEDAYAFGSYNWTKSATTINDEILEIGTDATFRQTYEDILLRLFDAYKDRSAAAGAAASISGGTYDYTEASAHVGEYASVRGTVVRVYTSNTDTTFLNFCTEYKTCPFSAVIFADDKKKFGDVSKLQGKALTLTGKIVLYDDRAEIVLSDPSQILD